MFIFSPNPITLEDYDSSVIVYPAQIKIVRGENTSLFFKYQDSYGFGVDLSEHNASLVIKRYPTSDKILFFMDEYSVFYGIDSEDFIYSPTASSVGLGGSIVNQDINENNLTGGIVFPIYGQDIVGLPKGNHYYEVSVKNSQERKMLFEGRIYVEDLEDTLSSQDVPQKNIEIVRGEDKTFFFKKMNNYGNGMDLTGTSAIITVRRYPSDDNILLYAKDSLIYTETGLSGSTGINYTNVNVDENENYLVGGIIFHVPNEISTSIPQGRHFYKIEITGSNEFTNPVYEGRIDFIQGFVDFSSVIPVTLREIKTNE